MARMADKVYTVESGEIGFSVTRIAPADKPNRVLVYVQFSGCDSEYAHPYIPQVNTTAAQKTAWVSVNGCKVVFDKTDYSIKQIKRVADWKGKVRTVRHKGGEKPEQNPAPEIPVENPVQEPENTKQEWEAAEREAEAVKASQEIKTEDAPADGEVRHEAYEEILACLDADIPVYLAGPAGAGKNFTVEQICWNHGWGFYFSNSIQQEYKLTGFVDANGVYHETQFYKAAVSGEPCVFFLDELDASIPDVVILLNAAIANGYFEFPTWTVLNENGEPEERGGKIDLKHVKFVAAGNTVGTGADDLYTGRAVLDAATLDRFTIIEFNYDMRVEMSLTDNNAELVAFIHDLREYTTKNGIRGVFSYRCMIYVTKLEKGGKLDIKKILKMTVFKGMDVDTIKSICIYGDNKYYRAFSDMKNAA